MRCLLEWSCKASWEGRYSRMEPPFFSQQKIGPKSHGKYRTFKTEVGFEKETALQQMIGKIVEPHIGKIKWFFPLQWARNWFRAVGKWSAVLAFFSWNPSLHDSVQCNTHAHIIPYTASKSRFGGKCSLYENIIWVELSLLKNCPQMIGGLHLQSFRLDWCVENPEYVRCSLVNCC